MDMLTMDELEAGLNGDRHRDCLAEIVRRARERDSAKQGEQDAWKEVQKARYVWGLTRRCSIQHIQTLTLLPANSATPCGVQYAMEV
jgi:hypothetical protein